MTVCTCNIYMPAQQSETGSGMVEVDVLPGCRLMTRLAIRTQRTAMRIILIVAGETICWRCTFEKFVGMAILTGNIYMSFCELEG